MTIARGHLRVRPLRSLLLILGLFALVLVPVGCSSSSTTTTTAGETVTTAAGGGVSTTAAAGGTGATAVDIKGFAFSPASLTVKVGDTVTWTNNDSVAHTVAADDNSWDSGNMDPGATYQHTFDQAGTVAYHCGVHPNMKATIVVQ